MTRLLVAAIFRLYFRAEYEGVENVPQEGAMIVAPNHVSYLDPIWVSIPLNRPLRYMAWDKLTRKPVIGPLMRAYGAFPVNVDSGKGDRAALRHSLEHLRGGGALMIFPEGSRSRDGKLTEFKAGVVRLALDTKAPIIPVTIIGGFKAYAPHHLIPRPYKLKVIYHEPIELTPPADTSRIKDYMRDQSDKLHARIASRLPKEEIPVSKQKVIES